jgi:hypothetical protein
MREREREDAADLDELLVLAANLVDAEHRVEAERRRRHYRGDRLLHLLNDGPAGRRGHRLHGCLIGASTCAPPCGMPWRKRSREPAIST